MKKILTLTEAEKALIKGVNDVCFEAEPDVENDTFIEGRLTVSTNKNEYSIITITGVINDGQCCEIESMDDCAINKRLEETLDRLEDDEDVVAVYADVLVRKKIKID